MSIILSIILALLPQPLAAYANNPSVYAQVVYNDVLLYKTPNDIVSLDNVHFTLERTYFVQLFSSSGEFYYAKYNMTYGYVLKSLVQCVSGVPNTPFVPIRSFRVYGEMSRSMRTIPTQAGGESTQLIYLPIGTTNVSYIASVTGQELIAERTKIWYYARYTTDKEYYGYIYSDMCDKLDPVLPNTQRLTYIDPPKFLSSSGTISSIDTGHRSIIILILSVPALAFTVLLLRSDKILNREHSKPVKLSKREITTFN